MKAQIHIFSNFPDALASLVYLRPGLRLSRVPQIMEPKWLCPSSPVLDMCAHGNHDIHTLEYFAMLFLVTASLSVTHSTNTNCFLVKINLKFNQVLQYSTYSV